MDESGWRPSREELDRIEKEIWRDPPPDPEPEVVNGALRALDGRFASKNVAFLLERAKTISPVHALQAVAILKRKVRELENYAVEIARAAGWPWRAIGDMLGTSASGAYRRYGAEIERRAAAREAEWR